MGLNNEIHSEVNILSTEIGIIEAIAFDMDGLLLNTEDLYDQVGKTLMERRGKEYRDEVRQQMIGLPAEQAFSILIAEERLTETWRDLQKETDTIFKSILPSQLATMIGVREFLDAVKKKQLPRCVATSSTHEFARSALGQLGLLDDFDFLITSEDVERGKPYPDIYLEAARRMGVSVSNMLVLEDSPKGTKAGVTAGAYVVSVPNQHTKGGSFEGSQWVADTLRDSRLYKLLGIDH